jgi:hypothetical protein
MAISRLSYSWIFLLLMITCFDYELFFRRLNLNGCLGLVSVTARWPLSKLVQVSSSLLVCGVLSGSVLGPILIILYTLMAAAAAEDLFFVLIIMLMNRRLCFVQPVSCRRPPAAPINVDYTASRMRSNNLWLIAKLKFWQMTEWQLVFDSSAASSEWHHIFHWRSDSTLSFCHLSKAEKKR